jgi:hypothetical protein
LNRICITIPAHDALVVGILKGILQAVASHKGVTIDDIIETLK